MTHGSDRAIRRLSVAASFGLVLMVGATAGYVLWPRVAGAIGLKPAAPPLPPPAYSAGQHVDVPAVWYNTAPRTLIVFARASCAACEKAHPFLKSLVSDLNGRAVVVMAHPVKSAYEDNSFATSLGIADANVHEVTPNLRVKATPTIVLVNQQGAILAAWEGAGSPEHQAEIRKTIEQKLQ